MDHEALKGFQTCSTAFIIHFGFDYSLSKAKLTQKDSGMHLFS